MAFQFVSRFIRARSIWSGFESRRGDVVVPLGKALCDNFLCLAVQQAVPNFSHTVSLLNKKEKKKIGQQYLGISESRSG